MTTSRRRRPWLRIALGVYCALLLASTVVRLADDEQQPLPEDRQTMEILTPGGEGTLRIAWKQTGSRRPEALPLVLLHGSPGSADNFDLLTELPPLLAMLERLRSMADDERADDGLADRTGENIFARVRRTNLDRPTIAPDLPGFGASDHRVADYSSGGHADSTRKLLDRLGVERFHALGFSMGGAVALHLADQAPERVASIILMSSIGVQELELLGDYRVNHGLHGLQLGLFWGTRNLVPHFGALDMAVARSYARNFYDTDQRPLRGILESLQAPVFIIHGEQDPLVPAAAAREHHRIVPHSELWMRPDSHFFLFRGDEHLAARIEDFLGRVEAGAAATRADAEPERLRQAALPFDDLDLPPFTGPALLIVFLLLVFAAYASEDLTCITAGLLVAQGRLDFPVAVAACYVGILSSDLGIAWLARVLGRPALRLPPFKWWVSEARFEEASTWLRRRALVVVLVSRFLPGTRLPTCLAAGILRTSLLRFCFYFALAVAIWTPAFVGVNALLGREAVERFGGRLPGGLLGAVLALAVVIFTVRGVVVPLFTWRGRRVWRGRLMRVRYWEFWPMWAFYPPLALYILWQGLRRRSLTAFTAINPAMPLGGLLGESKSDILDDLAGIGEALPAWRRLPTGNREERIAALDRFLEDKNLDHPVVLKPDTGERGLGARDGDVLRSNPRARARAGVRRRRGVRRVLGPPPGPTRRARLLDHPQGPPHSDRRRKQHPRTADPRRSARGRPRAHLPAGTPRSGDAGPGRRRERRADPGRRPLARNDLPGRQRPAHAGTRTGDERDLRRLRRLRLRPLRRAGPERRGAAARRGSPCAGSERRDLRGDPHV